MSKITKKQAYAKYLSGCEYFGLEPEFQYEERTCKEMVSEVNQLNRRWNKQRRGEVVDSVKANTEQALNFVQQKAGESRKSVLDRAKALKAKVPFTVSIRWTAK